MVHGDVHGIVSTGDYPINVNYVDGRFVQTQSVLELPLRDASVLAAPAPAPLFGRDDIVEQVGRELAGGTSVQLYGAAGVGKQAIAEAVHRKLAGQGRRGHVLWPRPGETLTLAILYQRLAEAFFGKSFLREVDETVLRAAVAAVSDVHITAFDCALDGSDVARVLQTFSGCTFLFTSPYATLPAPGASHHVQPLGREAAIELLSSELGLPLGPVGLQHLQFDHVYRMSEGKPQRLFQYAQFIKGSDRWRAGAARGPHDQPPPVDPDQLSPQLQAEALAVALSEPARRVLVALTTFGTPLAAAWFAPVTGDPQAASAGAELHDRRLVTRRYGTYQITEEAASAVRSQNWPPTSATTAAEGLSSALTTADGPPPPEPFLLLSIARALYDAQEWALTVRFVKTAAPIALTAGRGQIALQLYALGKIAATRGGRPGDLDYYTLAEEHTRNVLTGDRAAVAAALAVVSAPVVPTAKIGNLIAHLTKLGTAKLAVAAGAAAVVAAAATVAVVAASGPDTPAGCAEAKQALGDLNATQDTRVVQDLVGQDRKVAAGLSAAAAKATDPKVRSAIQTRADQRNNAADTLERNGDGLGGDVHPDVRANLLGGQALHERLQDRITIRPVCPKLLD
ncbi:ATP-binding protein [Streptomyces sp. GS7]|uniref:ATP-binding protein n=1 Tax=Streptomyces sp. GS7 TaxID=2692234 RepID=UPI0013175BC6|nr:ATP-binding protein [Streptomyces sp. GS7]QHC26451.1 hypothetical protein GR130_38875 [Streptomyces sp. GS7]